MILGKKHQRLLDVVDVMHLKIALELKLEVMTGEMQTTSYNV